MGLLAQEVWRQVGGRRGGWGCPEQVTKHGRRQPWWGDVASPILNKEDAEGLSVEGGCMGDRRGRRCRHCPVCLPAGPAPLCPSPQPGRAAVAVNRAVAAAWALRGAEASGERGRPGKHGAAGVLLPAPLQPPPQLGTLTDPICPGAGAWPRQGGRAARALAQPPGHPPGCWRAAGEGGSGLRVPQPHRGRGSHCGQGGCPGSTGSPAEAGRRPPDRRRSQAAL